MNATPDHVVKTVASMPDYVELFKKSNEAAPVTFDNFAKALEAFEATLMPASRFDQFLEGDANALNAQEKNGLTLFMEKGCVACHNGCKNPGVSEPPSTLRQTCQVYHRGRVLRCCRERCRPRRPATRLLRRC